MSNPIPVENCTRCGGTKRATEACPHCLLQLGLAQTFAPGARKQRPAPPTPAEIAPHFPGLELEAVIGQGGMGVVYRARQKKLDRTVALKLLAPELSGDPAFAERFLREARAMARLEHKNIVAVHDFGETDGLCWILMEHVEGVNLRQALASGRLAPAQALAIVPQLCDALAAAHAQGVVHRDIKPENVLIASDGVVKVADFGLAKLTGPGGAELALTQSDAAMGTLHYMAPEQLVGAREVDHRADIYSLGVVFYEMLTGELPLGRFEPPSHRAEMDAGLDEIVLRSLERAPERRYQQAAEVKTDVQGLGTRAAPTPAPIRSSAIPTAKPATKIDVGMLVVVHVMLLLLAPTTARVVLGWPGGLVWSSLVLASFLTFALIAIAQRDARLALDTWTKREMLARGLGCVAVAAIALGAAQYGFIALWEEGTDRFEPSTNPLRLAADVTNPAFLRTLFDLAPGDAANSWDEAGRLARKLDPLLRVHGPDGRALVCVGFLMLPFAALFLARRSGQTSLLPVAAAPLLVLLPLGYARLRFDGQESTWSVRKELKGTIAVDDEPRELLTALRSVCEERGYEVVLALGVEQQLAVLAVQPNAWSERWDLTSDGPRRLGPGIVFGIAQNGATGASSVFWDAGVVIGDEPLVPRWTAEVESLIGEARRSLGR